MGIQRLIRNVLPLVFSLVWISFGALRLLSPLPRFQTFFFPLNL